MRIAIIGSRTIKVENFESYIPPNVSEIVSGGARGIDVQAAEYAKSNSIPLMEFLPEYARYGRIAPLKRNEQIAQYADAVLAFWDGRSRGTMHTVFLFRRLGKPITVIEIDANGEQRFGNAP